MRIFNSFKGFDGKQLLSLVKDDCSAVRLRGEMVRLIPRVVPFCGWAEIASKEDATHVGVQNRWMHREILVLI